MPRKSSKAESLDSKPKRTRSRKKGQGSQQVSDEHKTKDRSVMSQEEKRARRARTAEYTSKRAKAEFATYKRTQLKIAKELFYPEDIIKRIQLATQESEIQVAMVSGRQRMRS